MDLTKVILLALMTATILGCGASPAGKKEAELKKEVASRLKDPDTVKFQNTKLVNVTSTEVALCGELNAKNSYGGYVGYVRFIATQGGGSSLIYTHIESAGVPLDKQWKLYCAGA